MIKIRVITHFVLLDKEVLGFNWYEPRKTRLLKNKMITFYVCMYVKVQWREFCHIFHNINVHD